MQKKEHKRKMNHVVIVTSDAADANVKQFRIRPWFLQAVILVLCIIIGALLGYMSHEKQIWSVMNQKNEALQENVERLEREKEALHAERKEIDNHIAELNTEIGNLNVHITGLNEEIRILGETVTQKSEAEQELLDKLAAQSLPTEFPLTGSATMEEVEDEELMCIFKASKGATVVATAAGTVTAVNEDVDYGHSIWVEHGNGYITVYKNKGTVTVSEGDSVVRGSTLFVIGDKDLKVMYQMKKDGEYIDPMDMLAING